MFIDLGISFFYPEFDQHPLVVFPFILMLIEKPMDISLVHSHFFVGEDIDIVIVKIGSSTQENHLIVTKRPGDFIDRQLVKIILRINNLAFYLQIHLLSVQLHQTIPPAPNNK
jgi:hypothetical protein